jgi:CheY-like chemotaxis protein
MTILIADDDQNDAALVLRALRGKGVHGEFHVVSDGTDVLRYLSASDEFSNRGKFPFPDLIILDLKMHGLSGLKTLEQISGHRAWSTIPIVVLSGFADFSDVKHAYALGAKTFFIKPLQAEDLEQLADLASGRSWFDQVRRENRKAP